VLEEMRQGPVIGQVVDCDDIDLVRVALQQRLEALPADSAEAIDRNARHNRSFLWYVKLSAGLVR
jgi:hypothetical protein